MTNFRELLGLLGQNRLSLLSWAVWLLLPMALLASLKI